MKVLWYYILYIVLTTNTLMEVNAFFLHFSVIVVSLSYMTFTNSSKKLQKDLNNNLLISGYRLHPKSNTIQKALGQLLNRFQCTGVRHLPFNFLHLFIKTKKRCKKGTKFEWLGRQRTRCK